MTAKAAIGLKGLREQTIGESFPLTKTILSGMTRGRTRLYLSLDKLERTSWSYIGHNALCKHFPT